MSNTKNAPKFSGGMVVPLATPFTPDFKVDVPALKALCELHVSAGTSCIFLHGTTGEFYGLTLAQRAQVVDVALEAINGRIPVICGISGDSTTSALEAYRNCRRDTLAGYVASTPYFFVYNQAELCDYFRSLSDVAGALILYNFPARYRHRIDIPTVATLLKEKRAFAIKDTAGDFAYLCELIELKKSHPGLLVLESALHNMGKSAPLGIDGSVQALANLLPHEFAALWSDIQQRRFETVAAKSARLWGFHEKMTINAPFISALKALMAGRGWCSPLPALPTHAVTGAAALELQRGFDAFLKEGK